jgi:hypothetical protein
MRTRKFSFGRVLAVCALLASFAAVFATTSTVSAATNSVTIHNATCSTQASDHFNECHANYWAGVGFSIAGYSRVTNASGVTSANVPSGNVVVAQDPGSITDGGQFIYCSDENSGRVLYGDYTSGGSITINVKSGERVICDWYNLIQPEPQGIGFKLHSYQCPSNTTGDIFSKCHRDSRANAGVNFTVQGDSTAVVKRTSSAGTFTIAVPTASAGWIDVTITEAPSAVTANGAFVYCSTSGGSGDILGGITVYNGQVTVQIPDGASVTCDWFNWT